ncbi:MAG: hypothetical protein J6V04_04990 [Bacteroidales bacterium]|nr:hypothetical protein [Bacteroidales bacterium]
MEDLLPILFSLLFIVVPALLGNKKKSGKRVEDAPPTKTADDLIRELLGEDYKPSFPEYESDDTYGEVDVHLEGEEEVPYSIEYMPQQNGYIESVEEKPEEKIEPVKVAVPAPKEIKSPSEIEKGEISSEENAQGDKKGKKFEIDTRKMILYSEILKPKYME